MDDAKNISENIKRYRYQNKITQEELAHKSGVALATIKKIETGKSAGIRRKTAEAIAYALSVDMNSLLAPARKLTTIRFRSCRNMRSKESVISYIINKLDRYNKLESLTDSYLPENYKTVEPVAGPAENAIILRTLAGLDNISPVLDISRTLSMLGIKLFSASVNTDKFFSLSVGVKDGGPAVIVNNNDRLTYEQLLFSIAHEVGHFIMHSERLQEINNEIIWSEEDEADLFASHFIMPEEGLNIYWNSGKGLHWTDRVIKVKQIFGVHYKTVLYRLGNFDRLYECFLKEYKNGELKDDRDPEPLNRKLYIEERMYSMAVKAVNEKKITVTEGSEILNISKADMKKFVQSL
ncbi:MAG: ImmA/IrrE family metallo-endopeptidase [Deferribacteraceae bacterium]|jgi:Zn-dependent peptidase ImmA (M78 family)/transcriptional regulator with XRE-family HTH domain|nr:ImmA/IrrE family metallo-endopeptidase [Deferribacteraceae bacterium]